MSPSVVRSSYGVLKEWTESKWTESRGIPYESTSVKGVQTAQTVRWEGVLALMLQRRPTPIMRIRVGSRAFRLTKPLMVRIYPEVDLFFVANDNLLVYGTGETPEAAYDDFCAHILYFYEYYRSLDESQLTGDAVRLKEIYGDLLIEERDAG